MEGCREVSRVWRVWRGKGVWSVVEGCGAVWSGVVGCEGVLGSGVARRGVEGCGKL